jgi:tetratricopeptide (TPR) repeat protein
LHDEGVREYSKALDLCPEFVDLRVALGNVYRDMGMYNAAVAEFEHAKRLRADFLPARINLGVVLYSLGRRDEAIAEWQAALDHDPANKSASLYLRMVRDEHAPRPGSALPVRDE